MRFLRSLVSCLVFLTAGPLVYGQSGGLNELSLGPIVLIGVDSSAPDAPRLLPLEPQLGPIIKIAAFFESDADEPLPPAPPNEEEVSHRLTVFEAAALPIMHGIPVRVIGHPMPAPIGEPFAFGAPLVPEPVHPEEIQAHLSAAAAQLAAAGLTGEAHKIHEFQEQLDRNHSHQLLIAFKESQIRALQAEVEFLKRNQQHVAGNVSLRVKMRIVELNLAARAALLSKLKNGGPDFSANTMIGTVVGSCDPESISDVVENLCRHGDAKIISEPDCTILDGRNMRFASGRENQGPIMARIGEEPNAECSPPHLESSISLTPHVLNQERIQLKLTGEYRFMDAVDVAGFHSRRLQSATELSDQIEATVELPSGQTMAMIGKDHGKTLLLLVTPEIVPNSELLRSTARMPSPGVVFETQTLTYQSRR